jgi:Ca2+-binding EF-hand superfamily protein
MNLARYLLIGAAFALAAGCSDDKPKSGRAADKNNDGKISSTEHRAPSVAKPTGTAANKPRPQNAGFNGLDKNSDGYLTRVEARGNPQLASKFKAADRNSDGKLNRAEYRAVVTKNDVKTAKTRGTVHQTPSARTGESTVPPQ